MPRTVRPSPSLAGSVVPAPKVADRPLLSATTDQLNHLLTHPLSPDDPQGEQIVALQLAADNELIQRGQGSHNTLMQLERIARLDARPFYSMPVADQPLIAVAGDVNYLRQAAVWAITILNARQNPGNHHAEAIGLETLQELLKRPWDDPSVLTATAQASRSLIRPNQKFDPQLHRIFELASHSPVESVARQGQAGLAAYPFPLDRATTTGTPAS